MSAEYFDVSSTVDHNLIQTNYASYASLGNNVINKDPMFKKVSLYDFDLAPESPAKDKGTTLSPPITDDYCNRPRTGVPDMGAYEVQ
jgi:hypothetical protein